MDAVLTGCYPPAYVVKPRSEEIPPPAASRLYFYPAQGQSPTREERDRYECYLWAVKKSGFDPSRTPLAPHQQVEVIPEPAIGTNTAVGAAGGAVIGSIMGGRHERGEGVVVGAITGAMLGAASDAARQGQAQEIQKQYDLRYARNYARAERQAHNYERAMAACLEGRGYTVR